MDTKSHVDVCKALVGNAELQEGRVVGFDALAKVEVEFLDACKVVDMRGRMCAVMVDGKGVAIRGKSRAADDVAADG